jgi:hypothetical protein
MTDDEEQNQLRFGISRAINPTVFTRAEFEKKRKTKIISWRGYWTSQSGS